MRRPSRPSPKNTKAPRPERWGFCMSEWLVSRVLSLSDVTVTGEGNHSSRAAIADGLQQPTRGFSDGTILVADVAAFDIPPYSVLLQMGFTWLTLLPASPVSSYLTLSPTPVDVPFPGTT